MNDTAAIIATIEEAVRRGDVGALIKYARTAESAGNLGVATVLWQKAFAVDSSAEVALMLVKALEKANRTSEALAICKQVLAAMPTHHGRTPIETVEHDLTTIDLPGDPGDPPSDPGAYFKFLDAKLKAAEATWASHPAGAVRIEEELLEQSANYPKYPGARLAILRQLVLHKEWYERMRRGEAAYHASRPEELHFHYARNYVEDLKRTSKLLLAAKPDDDEARTMLAAARFALGDRHGAEAVIHSPSAPAHSPIWETVKFAPAFYDELRNFSDEEMIRSLPPLLEVAAMPGNPTNIVYLSCNYTYFVGFALPMVMSLRDRSPKTAVHLHIMDASPESTDFIAKFMRALSPLAFAISAERPGLERAPTIEARCYYHAVRFIRFFQHLKSYRAPLWLMDVDALINRDLGDLCSRLSGYDIAIRIRPGRLEPWNQFNACMVGASHSPKSLEYFRLIAAYVAYFHKRNGLRWGIDQMAMYGVFADMRDRDESPSLTLLGPRDVDYDHEDSGFVWPNSGGAKLTHLKRISTPGAALPNPPVSKFDILFEDYWRKSVETARSVGTAI